MTYNKEAGLIIKALRSNCERLTAGYEEKVDYKVKVAYHGATCRYHGRTNQPRLSCDCRTEEEARVRTIRRPGLLLQLRDYQKSKDTDRNPKAERAAPRVKTPKSHPELAGFFTLDEITVDVYTTVDRALEQAGRDRGWASDNILAVIGGLASQVGYFVDTHREVAQGILAASYKWVNQAERTLNITVADAQFADTVCGNCNGGLAIAWDNSGEVRCLGTLTTPPCGATYGPGDWLELFGKKV